MSCANAAVAKDHRQRPSDFCDRRANSRPAIAAVSLARWTVSPARETLATREAALKGPALKPPSVRLFVFENRQAPPGGTQG